MVKTDHKSFMATTADTVTDRSKGSVKRGFRLRTPNQHTSILHDLRDSDSRPTEAIPDLQAGRDGF